jgi:N-acetylglucosaminyldiphosphoundecaprenol N-acetyl-beta-D-mannosaminyltransferase
MESRQLRSAGPIRDDRVDILGVGVSPINLDDAIATIERWISEGSRNYVCITGVHGVMESRRNQRLRRIHNEAGMVTPDGMPLVWLSRLLGKHRTERVYGPDLMRKVTAVSSLRGYRQFYYGGAEGVADKLKQALITAHPKLDVAGTLHDRCRGCVRLPGRRETSAVDATTRTRVVVSSLLGAAAFVAPLCLYRAGLHHSCCRRSRAPRNQTLQ